MSQQNVELVRRLQPPLTLTWSPCFVVRPGTSFSRMCSARICTMTCSSAVAVSSTAMVLRGLERGRIRLWDGSPLPDSNRRPLPYHGSALPTELRGRAWQRSAGGSIRRREAKWGEQDSNLRRLSREIYSLVPLTAWVSPRDAARESRRTSNGALIRPGPDKCSIERWGSGAQEASRSRCASGSSSSFFSVLFSIWRIRSRVTPNARPTSSSVRAWWPLSP